MAWTCQRKAKGERCGHLNGGRKRLCEICGKPRPARKRPAHMAALELSYAEYLALNGGVELCAICGAGPKTRKLQRDHCHRQGVARGLLCARCNRALPSWMTVEWLRAATAYLERSQ